MDMSMSSMPTSASSMSMSSMASMSAMPSSTTTGMMGSSMGGMSGMDMSSMQMGMMMTFFTSTSTPLFTHAFDPHNVGQYAGICIFLILLSLVLRGLLAFRCACEARWQRSARKQRFIVVAGGDRRVGSESGVDSDSDASSDGKSGIAGVRGGEEKLSGTVGVLTTNGVTENVKILEDSSVEKMRRQPWRLSVDLPRALLGTLILAVGYLLMLAVMTMNVGYFLSVLAGAFVGELFLGRFTVGHVEDHQSH